MKISMWQEQDAMRRGAIHSEVIPRGFDDEKKRSCLIAALVVQF
jgi:hypothetical protein